MSELSDLAARIAEEAGALAAATRLEGVTVAATKSSPIDMVTRADRAAEALIRGRIAELRPRDGFLGEESGAESGTSGLTWVVDPIDGTANYFYDLPNWSVSIAVVEGDPAPETWTVIAGVVHAPAMGTQFRAARGEGAFEGARRLSVRPPAALNRALVATGFHYTQEIRTNQVRVAAGLIPQIRDIRRAGGAALDLAAVAAGRIDAYYEQGLQPWDQAAGALLVTEAAGIVTGLEGAAPTNRMLLAGGPEIAGLLGAELERLGA